MFLAPRFSASLIRSTAEGEQLTIAVTAKTPAELADRIEAAGDLAQAQLERQNARVLRVAQKVTADTEAILGRAVRTICTLAGFPIPAEYALQPRGEANGHDAQGGTDADPDGVVHAPADS